jgi:hypothetical protein
MTEHNRLMIISVECILNLTIAWRPSLFKSRNSKGRIKFELGFEDFGVCAQISPWIKNTQ